MLEDTSWAIPVIAGLIGLLIGSFLNVVIYRLPLILERQWLRDSSEWLSDAREIERVTDMPATHANQLAAANSILSKALEQLPPLSLWLPRSRCRTCGHLIAWHDNIPVFSYLVLRGQCSVCKTAISPRYPAVELLTGAVFSVTAHHYGLTLQGLIWAVFAAILIVQFFIDFDTQLLPDSLNYPLLWLGLIAAAAGWTVPLKSAMWGAVAGYLSLWLLYHAYRMVTNKEGMGHGDFKLLAALGVWFGSEHVLAIILLSSLVGSAIGIILLIVKRISHMDTPIPFGPFLAGAGLLCLLLGPGKLAQLLPIAFPFSSLMR
jgi:leader peptidase (prepilin peptidase)/N-methyltransferase